MAQRKTKTPANLPSEIHLKFIGAKVPAADADKLRVWARKLDLTVSQVLRRIVRERIVAGSDAVTAE